MLDMTIHNEERPKIKIAAKNLNFFYGDHQSLFDNNLEIPENRITAVIGPSGCGKSTHLRIYNRIFELYREQRVEGEVIIDGQNILDRNVDVLELRRKVGMIFQRRLRSRCPFSITSLMECGFTSNSGRTRLPNGWKRL